MKLFGRHFTVSVATISWMLFWIFIYYLPFHAFITTLSTTWFTDSLLLKALKDIFAVALLSLVFVAAIFKNPQEVKRVLMRPVNSAVLLLVVLYTLYLNVGDVSPMAELYGLVINTRYLLFFITAQLVVVLSTPSIELIERKMATFAASTLLITSSFGILQLLSSPTFMESFGYSQNTIAPLFTVDSQSDTRRIFSTLRGPNPFGTYLAFAITILGALYQRIFKTSTLKLLGLCIMVLSVISLYYTYSRGAWIALFVSICAYVLLSLKGKRQLYATLGVTLVLGAVFFSITILSHNSFVQRVVFHRDTRNESKIVKSDEARYESITVGIERVKEKPLGCGIGCSGPASIYYPEKPINIPENYYLQIAQEVGMIGFTLYISVLGLVSFILLKARSHPVGRLLLATLIGLSVASLFSHVWADDTISYLWWGFAGLFIGWYRLQKSSTLAVKK